MRLDGTDGDRDQGVERGAWTVRLMANRRVSVITAR